MPPATIPVFLNGHSAWIPSGSTLRQLVLQEDPELGASLQAGLAVANDARGLPVDADALLVPGAIFRVFRSARAAGGRDDA